MSFGFLLLWRGCVGFVLVLWLFWEGVVMCEP